MCFFKKCSKIVSVKGQEREPLQRAIDQTQLLQVTMKATTITTSKATVKDNRIEWVDEKVNTVCASTKSVNNACDALREKHVNVIKVEAKDFYINEEVASEHIANMVANSDIDEKFVNATMAHIFEAMRKACCFIPKDKE